MNLFVSALAFRKSKRNIFSEKGKESNEEDKKNIFADYVFHSVLFNDCSHQYR